MAKILTLLFTVLVIAGIFLICRAIVLWYWRVTDIIKNQEDTIQQLKTLSSISNKQVELLMRLLEKKESEQG